MVKGGLGGINFYELSSFTSYYDVLFIVPVCTYLDLEMNMKSILKDNRGKSGVYRWTNKVTGDIYIGSAVNLSRRLGEYF